MRLLACEAATAIFLCSSSSADDGTHPVPPFAGRVVETFEKREVSGVVASWPRLSEPPHLCQRWHDPIPSAQFLASDGLRFRLLVDLDRELFWVHVSGGIAAHINEYRGPGRLGAAGLPALHEGGVPPCKAATQQAVARDLLPRSSSGAMVES